MARMTMSVIVALLLTAGAGANSVSSQARERALEEAWSKELQTPVTYKNPVKRVVALLEKMKAELTAEAGKEASMYDKMVCWCETNDKEKTAAIADAEAKMSSLEMSVKAKAAKKGELETEIAATKKQIAADTASLKTASAIREKESAEFSAEEKDMFQYITNLKNAIAVLSEHHSAFLQLDSPIMASVRSVLQDVALKYEFLAGDHPRGAARAGKHPVAALLAVDSTQGLTDKLFENLGGKAEDMPANIAAHFLAESAKKPAPGSAFMQASAKAPGYESYSARSTTIFGILTQMLDEFEASLSQAQKDELKAAEDFAALSKTKTEQIAAGKAKLDAMEGEAASNSKALSDDNDDLDATSAQRSADVKFLRNLKLTCQDLDRKYEERTTTRAEEVKAVSEAIAVLTEDDAREHLAKTTSFLQERSSADSAARARRSRAMAFLWSKAREPSFADDLLAEWHGRSSPRSSARSANSKLATLAVSVQLDSFTKVKEMMDKMVADLKAEQADEVQFKAKCGEDMNSNEKETFDKKEQKSDLEAKIDTLDKSISTLKDEIAAANKDIKYNEDEIAKASETREKETAEFKIVIADQRATQDILAKAIKRLEAFYGEKPSFLQGAAHVSQTPPVKFDAYATNAGSSTVLGLLAQIVEDSKKLEADATTAETTSQADYEAFVATSQDSIASLQKMVTEKTMSVSQAGVDRSQADSDLASTNDELATLSEVLADLHGQCDFVLKNFEIRQKARGEEIAAILSAKAILSGATA
mmetsp:Transcript_14716/g.26121  ORF Transcript_14716/g.26121 Transcript_14716/m.26121 type:complete len:763 (+) Transcript_14716:81-2369(+)